jgi:hypothetical protein
MEDPKTEKVATQPHDSFSFPGRQAGKSPLNATSPGAVFHARLAGNGLGKGSHRKRSDRAWMAISAGHRFA